MKKFLLLSMTLFSSVSFGQWSVDSLDDARMQMQSITVGDKAYFISGVNGSGSASPSGLIDVFEPVSNMHSSFSLIPRFNPAVGFAGDRLLVAGGEINTTTPYGFVDVYDTLTASWSLIPLKGPRVVGGTATINNKVFFAGGRGNSTFYSRVDIYNGSTNTWTAATLSRAREKITASVVGQKILFAGGNARLTNGQQVSVRNVDIYDEASGVWSAAMMSSARSSFAKATIGRKVFLAGGVNNSAIASKVVDVYDDSTNTWSVKYLSVARYAACSYVYDNKAYFAGGYLNAAHQTSARVDIYDNTTGKWSTTNMPIALAELVALQAGKYIYFAGGINSNGLPTDTVLVLNTSNKTWTIQRLSSARAFLSAVRLGDYFLFAGGAATTNGGYSKTVDVLHLTPGSARLQAVSPAVELYPNPAAEQVYLSGLSGSARCDFELFDLTGKRIRHGLVEGNSIPVAELKSGIYFLHVRSKSDEWTLRFIKE